MKKCILTFVSLMLIVSNGYSQDSQSLAKEIGEVRAIIMATLAAQKAQSDAQAQQIAILSAKVAAIESKSVKPKVKYPSGWYVLFVKTEEQSVGKYATIRDDNYDAGGVFWTNGNTYYRLNPSNLLGEIQRIEGTVQPTAYPFLDPFNSSSQRYEQPTVDGSSPWLAVSEQKKIRAMWPEEVPFPDTLKFYKLVPASQRVAAFGTPGAGNSHRFVPVSLSSENPNREFPWIGSGGMDFAQKGTWRNVTGMAIPAGSKIDVWRAYMQVSSQQEVAVHWQFPTGTQMFDVLIRRNDDGSEHIFNVRRRIKEEKGWDDGASFLPDVEDGKVNTYESIGGERSRRVLGIPLIRYRTFTVNTIQDKKPKFRMASDASFAMNDGGHFFPPGFVGAGMSCNKCHNGAVHESKDYGGPLLRGKDTVFSWYPIDRNLVVASESLPSGLFEAAHVPSMDYRWPITYARK